MTRLSDAMRKYTVSSTMIGASIGTMVIGLVFVLITGCAAMTDMEAPVSQAQTVSQIQTTVAPSIKPAWLTPEKEAALVEARKILREASQVAQSVVIKNSESKEGKFLVHNKRRVLDSIGGVQARAGDIEGARLTDAANGRDKSVAIGIALAKAGRPHEGLHEVASLELRASTRLVFVEAFVRSRDAKMAQEVAESKGSYLDRVPALACLASSQAKAGDPHNKETFHRALELTQGFDKLKQGPQDTRPNIGKYKALLHIARAQADAGDMVGSRETFFNAVATALAVPDIDRIDALITVAEEQARSGDQTGSERTFNLARNAARSLASISHLSKLERIARTQLEIGQRAAAAETVRLIVEVPSGASPRDQADGLMRQTRWHLAFGDQEAAQTALKAVTPQVRALADGYLTTTLEKDDDYYHSPKLGKSAIYYLLARLAAECGWYEMAQAAVQAITNEQTKADAIRHIIIGLIPKLDRPEVQQVTQALVKDATNLIGRLSFPRDLTLLDVAVIQAAAGDVPAAVRTADRVVEALRDNTYREMVGVLIQRNNWSGTQEVLSRMKAGWMLNESSHDAFRALGQAQAKAGMGKHAIKWAQSQQDAVARASVFLGVAEGVLDGAGIEPLFPVGRPYITNY